MKIKMDISSIIIYGTVMFISAHSQVTGTIAKSLPTNMTGTATFPNIICFYGYSVDLPPEQLNAFYCTHIITYGSITDNYTINGDKGIYSRITNLKNQNPDLKFLLSIGGSGANSTFSQIVHSPQLSDSFINQTLQFLTDNKFDGLDIDWEFPAWSGDPLDSRYLFPVFLQKFMEAATALSTQTGRPRLLLSVDVAAPLTIIIVSYNIYEIARNVDFVNIMCYDFHFYIWYDILTGSNAPLFKRCNENIIAATMNTAWAANEWNIRGMPKSKINVGIPTYGHTYNLTDPNSHGFNSLTSGPGMNGGWIDYPQVCKFVANGGVVVFDEESQVPYTYHENDWVSYDNVQSFISKTNHILNNGYAGTMVFSYNSDDYTGLCDGQTRFPLIATVHNVTTAYFQRKLTNI